MDIDKEIQRLTQEHAKIAAEVERSTKLLANQGFVAKAPKALIDKEQAKLAAYKEQESKLIAELNNLKNM